jgi:hypothetical protein
LRRWRAAEFPLKADYVRRLYTHNLEELIRLAELDQQLEADMTRNDALAKSWDIVRNWSEEARYRIKGLEARDLCAAVAASDGVLAWIRQRW